MYWCSSLDYQRPAFDNPQGQMMTVVHSLLRVLSIAHLSLTCKFGTLTGTEIKIYKF